MFIRGIANIVKKFTVKISRIVAGWVHDVLFMETAGEVKHFVVKISGILAVWVSGIAILISLGIYVIVCRIFTAAH